MVLNRVTVNVTIHFFSPTYVLFSFGWVGRLYMLGSFVRLTSSFSNMPCYTKWFSKWLYQFTSKVWEFWFHILTGPRLVLSVVLNFTVLSDMQWYFYGSYLFPDHYWNWNLFICTLTIWISFFMTWLFNSIEQYCYWDVCVFFLVLYWRSLFILDMSPLLVICIIFICVDIYV